MFELVVLDPEQKQLFCSIVDAFRALRREDRRELYLIKTMGSNVLQHPGFPGGHIDVYDGDLDAMAEAGLLRVNYGSRGTPRFDITPFGFQYYSHLKAGDADPLVAVETSITSFLNSSFSSSYPLAHQKWARAAKALWGPESSEALTDIGHLCRESMQYFVSDLVTRFKPDKVDPDPAHTVSRLKTVIASLPPNAIGRTERGLFETLIPFWGAVSDLAQRQEHGAQREGTRLEWEDGRRLVFHTAVVMYELSRACR